MSTKYSDVNVRCPYYLRERDTEIMCEGLEKGSELAVEFKGKQYKKKYREKYCGGDYEKCKLCQCIEEKYK